MRKRENNKKEIFKTLALITQIGLTMISCMAISLFIGYWLDRWFETRFCIIIFMFIGMGASIRNLLMITKEFTKDE